jgi:hypothetical protein
MGRIVATESALIGSAAKRNDPYRLGCCQVPGIIHQKKYLLPLLFVWLNITALFVFYLLKISTGSNQLLFEKIEFRFDILHYL